MRRGSWGSRGVVVFGPRPLAVPVAARPELEPPVVAGARVPGAIRGAELAHLTAGPERVNRGVLLGELDLPLIPGEIPGDRQADLVRGLGGRDRRDPRGCRANGVRPATVRRCSLRLKRSIARRMRRSGVSLEPGRRCFWPSPVDRRRSPVSSRRSRSRTSDTRGRNRKRLRGRSPASSDGGSRSARSARSHPARCACVRHRSQTARRSRSRVTYSCVRSPDNMCRPHTSHTPDWWLSPSTWRKVAMPPLRRMIPDDRAIPRTGSPQALTLSSSRCLASSITFWERWPGISS